MLRAPVPAERTQRLHELVRMFCALLRALVDPAAPVFDAMALTTDIKSLAAGVRSFVRPSVLWVCDTDCCLSVWCSVLGRVHQPHLHSALRKAPRLCLRSTQQPLPPPLPPPHPHLLLLALQALQQMQLLQPRQRQQWGLRALSLPQQQR